mmetsp:Transcript_6335/g.21235  ORF Transcript_6335/g.21235 Transcript_6335/m.21235 type:complete len:248 (+) Transcript_6335:713-1456(+)
MAVKKPCGLKNPVSQNALGFPFSSQFVSCACLCSNPWNQLPIVELSQLFDSHLDGTLASKSESRASTKEPESATVPATANRKFTKVDRHKSKIMFSRSISCRKCTVNGCVAPPGSFFSRSFVGSNSKLTGTLPSKSSAIASTISAGDNPPSPPPVLGIVPTTVSTKLFTCSVRKVKSALLCSPNTSGESWDGSASMQVRISSIVLQSGTWYPGNSVRFFSNPPRLKYFPAYVSISSSSNPSVIRPPY